MSAAVSSSLAPPPDGSDANDTFDCPADSLIHAVCFAIMYWYNKPGVWLAKRVPEQIYRRS